MCVCVCWFCRLGELELMAGRIMEMRQALKDSLLKESQCVCVCVCVCVMYY